MIQKIGQNTCIMLRGSLEPAEAKIAQKCPYIFPSFPSLRVSHSLQAQPLDLLMALCNVMCRCLEPGWFVGDPTSLSCDNILHTFQSVNPPHGQWPAPMGSWRVFHSLNFVQKPKNSILSNITKNRYYLLSEVAE